jgi:hypothetical protein
MMIIKVILICLFGALNKALKFHRFQSDRDIKAPVVQWFQQEPRELFADGILCWCISGTPASVPMGTIFNSPYSITQIRFCLMKSPNNMFVRLCSNRM